MKSVAINGQLRTSRGKKAAKDLRSEDQVLGVIYGGKEEIHFSAPTLNFRDVIYTHEFKKAEISVDGNSYSCIVKDIQFCPITDKILHVDFLELVDDKKVIADLPIRLKGQAAGVKAGGRLEQKMKTLRVRTYPKYLKEAVELDITDLKLLENLRVEDVKDENYEFMNPARQPIASIVMTRALRQAESEEKKAVKK